MKTYQLLAHTADIKVLAQGSSLQDLFTAGLEAMASILIPEKQWATCSEQVIIELSAPDSTVLFIDFLSEVLTIAQTKKIVFCKAAFKKLDHTTLCTTVYGFKVKKFDDDIKAVTYHEADVKKDQNGLYSTYLVFDI